jgi:hypothetical protein
MVVTGSRVGPTVTIEYRPGWRCHESRRMCAVA